MEHISIELALISIIAIYLVSSLIQKVTKIPLPHSIIVLSYLIYHYFPDFLNLETNAHFDQIIFFLIPIIIMADAIHLKWNDIKVYKWSILYLAVFSVTVSILLGTSLYYFGIFGGALSIGAYVALFSMNMATDAISVSNIFSQFKNVPHNIKVLVEGESLGNDATAMIAFYGIGLPWILAGSFDFTTIPMIVIKTFGISTLIGLIIGLLAYQILSFFKGFKEELVIIIGTAYASFTFAEMIHVSGLLAIIISVITLTTLIEKSLREEKAEVSISPENKKDLFKFMKRQVTTKTNQENIISTIDTFSFIAAIFVFITMASMINVSDLIQNWKLILIMFVSTTLIRMIVMGKFVLVGKKTRAIDYVGFNGWVILTLAGIKGALSIIMLHSIPKNYEFYSLFESVTIGVILLSTFVYGFMLLFYMLRQDKKEIHE